MRLGNGEAMNELCVRCGKPTPYDISYPVDMRKWYIEGSGQLCPDCFNKLYENEMKMSATAHKRIDREYKDAVE